MKKLTTMCIVLCMASAMAACGTGAHAESSADTKAAETQAETRAELPNPLKEVTREEQLAETGMTADLPADCTDLKYFILTEMDGEGINKIAQIDFRYNGKDCTYRMKATIDPAGDMSGLNYTWTETTKAEIAYLEATVQTCDEAAAAYWFDVVPGISYSMGCTGNMSADEMTTLINAVFAPAQGEVEGDIAAYDFVEGDYTNGEDDSCDTITLVADGDNYKVMVGIFRLCELEGEAVQEDGALVMELTDPSEGTMTANLVYNGETLDLNILDSTWELLPTDTQITGFSLVTEG